MRAGLDHLTEAELAAWQYEHRDDLDDAIPGDELIPMEISESTSVTISFRLPGHEAETIRQAATQAGVSVSEWIRRACAAAVDPDSALKQHDQVDAEIRRATRQLQMLAQRLDDATRVARSPASQADA